MRYAVGTYAGPASYPTGGEVLNAVDFKFAKVIQHLSVESDDAAADVRLFVPVVNAAGTANLKQHTAVNTETVNTTNTSTISARFLALGY